MIRIRARALTAGRLLHRVRGAHSNHRRIAAGAATIALLTLLAKAFVAAREIAIAWRYGVSATVDAYQLSFTIVTWLPMLLSAVMAVVLVPRMVALSRRREARLQFLSEFNGTILLVGVGIGLLTFLAAPWVSRIMASGLDSATVRLTRLMVERLCPIAFFMILSGYLTARLQAKERFGYTITEAVPALAIAGFLLSSWARHTIAPLILGAVIGYMAQAIILVRLVARGDPPIGEVIFRHRSEEWRTFYQSVLMMAVGQFVITATVPIDQAFAARVAPGAVATLGYANRIVTLFTGLASVVIGRALLPVLSTAVAEGDLVLGRRHTLQWASLMFGAAFGLSAALWAITPELVRLLFQRGAFQPSATQAVSEVMRYGLFQIPFFFGGIALVQWVAATGNYRDIVAVTVVALIVKLILNFILVRRFGLDGIMISSAAMYFVTSALLLLKIGRTTAQAGSAFETRL